LSPRRKGGSRRSRYFGGLLIVSGDGRTFRIWEKLRYPCVGRFYRHQSLGKRLSGRRTAQGCEGNVLRPVRSGRRRLLRVYLGTDRSIVKQERLENRNRSRRLCAATEKSLPSVRDGDRPRTNPVRDQGLVGARQGCMVKGAREPVRNGRAAMRRLGNPVGQEERK
jgi:hypothetical protein